MKLQCPEVMAPDSSPDSSRGWWRQVCTEETPATGEQAAVPCAFPTPPCLLCGAPFPVERLQNPPSLLYPDLTLPPLRPPLPLLQPCDSPQQAHCHLRAVALLFPRPDPFSGSFHDCFLFVIQFSAQKRPSLTTLTKVAPQLHPSTSHQPWLFSPVLSSLSEVIILRR